ncbi:hypothetical protein ACIF6L_26620 [Kitasatospora sp. NPDC086009]|uniref:hypothetical protein n=1 Tax=unclassified Kitasatospora TaxID=2633591 RepID=UPI0037C9EFB8
MDVEKVITRWLAEHFDVRTCTELPTELETLLPVVQVATIGGAEQRFTGRPRVDVDVYASTYEAARQLALRIRDGLKFWRGPADPGAVVTGSRIDASPWSRPYANPALRRVGLTVTISLHPAAH